MLVESYSSLVSRVQSYMARADLAADVPGFIQNWEVRFYRQPRNHGGWMEKPLSAVIASGVIPVPADFLNLKVCYVDGNPSSRLEYVSLDQLYGTYPRSQFKGIPHWIARDGANFVFGPEADSGYTIKGTYWGKPVFLRNAPTDATTHWIIVNAPDLPLYGALAEAEPFIKNDGRIATWKAFYAESLKDYRDLIEAEKHTSVSFEVLA